MNDLERARNDALHQRIDAAVAAGSAHEVPPGDNPLTTSLTDRFLANRRAGRPLMDGLTVFRGAKDPDVDAGTFHAGFKHASPMADLALGYAALANQKIGLVVPAAQGIGAMAEYAVPPNARFVGNFGLENDAKTAQALSLDELGERLEPLLDAYETSPAGDRPVAQANLLAFYRQHLYEIAVPADQPPLRRWVVQLNDATGAHRLLEHQEQGPLADVLVDVVRERKLAVDAHGPSRIVQELRRGGPSGLSTLDGFAPGVAQHLVATADRLDGALQALRNEAQATALTSLGEALVWRREQQHGIPLTRLTNSGMDLVFEHDHPDLKSATAIDEAFQALDQAHYASRVQPERQAVLQSLRATQALLREQQREHDRWTAAQAADDTAQAALSFSQNRRAQGQARLDTAQQTHDARRSAGFIARTLYRWTGEKQALADLAQRRAGLAAQDRLLEQRAETAATCRREREAQDRQRRTTSEALRTREQRLREQRKDGALSFLPAAVQACLEHPTPLTPDHWQALAHAAHRQVRENDRRIAQGRRAAQRFQAWAEHGLRDPSPVPSSVPAPLQVTPSPVRERERLTTRLDEHLTQRASVPAMSVRPSPSPAL